MFEEKTINALKWIVEILNEKNIPYQVSGGFSAKIYGSNRPLNDIDFDIPENDFDLILSEVSPYVIYGPSQYHDEKWDAYLMTLDFNGQEIDICGANKTKISNKDKTKWIYAPTDLSKTREIEIEGIKIKVISPEDLIVYKQYLDGVHQIEDINAVKKFLLKR